MDFRIDIPKSILTALNQMYELEQKLKNRDDSDTLGRILAKMRDAFAEEGLPTSDGCGGQLRIRLAYEDPMGQPFRETRTDLEATISGPGTEDLAVVEVIKPIIRATLRDGVSVVVQKGIVIVKSQKEQESDERDD